MSIKKTNEIKNKVKIVLIIVLSSFFTSVTTYANDGVTQYNNVLDWVLAWIGRIGIVIAVWGAVQIGLSFSTEDAGQRRKGILELISGLMVMAIGFGAKTIIGY